MTPEELVELMTEYETAYRHQREEGRYKTFMLLGQRIQERLAPYGLVIALAVDEYELADPYVYIHLDTRNHWGKKS